MKVELFPFQKQALASLRMQTAEALGSFHRTHSPQVVSFTAPTGAGKTIIMASLIENIFCGNEYYPDQENAIFVWLSDSPQLNEQSKLKIELKADKIFLNQCVTVDEYSIDLEFFEDGHIYFLNTQKLGKNSNLTKHSDSRQYTIWETLANTAREKSERLYFIIDEAHRGMLGSRAGEATTIMQKFLKGSTDDGIKPMPVVIGMSATSERFNRLAEGIASTVHKVIVTTDEVRSSGLLKDRIVITYPDEHSVNKDMAVLQAASDEWKAKCEHWELYCREQHYAQVNPVLVVQVNNGTGGKISDTDLDDCLQKIEERVGFRFESGEVVHTFGQTSAAIIVNGLEVPYAEPIDISDNKKIKVVFFKENLSTGWDCPRAETMMSFRHAKDATYIAQLLGRMVRTPMQQRVLVDDSLNDVHLYLPYFDADTVKSVVEALQSGEGGIISADIYGESLSVRTFETLTVRPVFQHTHEMQNGGNQVDLFDDSTSVSQAGKTTITVAKNNHGQTNEEFHREENKNSNAQSVELQRQNDDSENRMPVPTDSFDREAIVKFINDYGLLTYDVRTLRISNYLNSLYRMCHLLVLTGLHTSARHETLTDISDMIHEYAENLRSRGKYDELADMVRQFKLSTQIFDVFGETVDNYSVHDLFTTTDTDIDRQLRLAEHKLGNEGVANVYGNAFLRDDEPNEYKIDVILFVADEDCMKKLFAYAEEKFHALNDTYRRKIARIESERYRRLYDTIASDGDVVSKHNFRLPQTIQLPHDPYGISYTNHLFVNAQTGKATMKLNQWEAAVIAEEEKQSDFVCWLRNPPRKSWSLAIPYTHNGETKTTYPDFIIIRKDGDSDYVIDILEPHNPEYNDNLSKAKGFAEYARQNLGVGRIQLIRMSKDITGENRLKRLDMSKTAVREKVLKTVTNDELDHIFDTDGFCM